VEGTTSYRFERRDARRTRVLIASRDAEAVALVSKALRCDGHAVLAVSEATELAFVLEVVRLRAGPAPDVVIVDENIGPAAVLEVSRHGRGALGGAAVFVVLGDRDEAAHARLLDCASVIIVRRPVDLDDLRTAVLNVQAWNRHRALPAAPSMATA
jgi:DNA-binding response OmpR family regulator